MLRMIVTIDIGVTKMYLEYLKNQAAKYTSMKTFEITMVKAHSEIDYEIRQQLEVAKKLIWNKKAPLAEGANKFI